MKKQLWKSLEEQNQIQLDADFEELYNQEGQDTVNEMMAVFDESETYYAQAADIQEDQRRLETVKELLENQETVNPVVSRLTDITVESICNKYGFDTPVKPSVTYESFTRSDGSVSVTPSLEATSFADSILGKLLIGLFKGIAALFKKFIGLFTKSNENLQKQVEKVSEINKKVPDISGEDVKKARSGTNAEKIKDVEDILDKDVNEILDELSKNVAEDIKKAEAEEEATRNKAKVDEKKSDYRFNQFKSKDDISDVEVKEKKKDYPVAVVGIGDIQEIKENLVTVQKATLAGLADSNRQSEEIKNIVAQLRQDAATKSPKEVMELIEGKQEEMHAEHKRANDLWRTVYKTFTHGTKGTTQQEREQWYDNHSQRDLANQLNQITAFSNSLTGQADRLDPNNQSIEKMLEEYAGTIKNMKTSEVVKAQTTANTMNRQHKIMANTKDDTKESEYSHTDGRGKTTSFMTKGKGASRQQQQAFKNAYLFNAALVKICTAELKARRSIANLVSEA